MILKKSVTNALQFLKKPQETYKRIHKITLEQVLEDYMKLLLGAGIIAGILSILFAIIRAVYLQNVEGITIEYLRLLNYSLGTGSGIFFFYLFAGTFGMLILTTIIWIFLKKVKYYDFIKIMCLAIYPVFLFSWIYVKAAPMLLIWSLFLLVVGIREYNKSHASKDSLKQKENKKINKENVQKTKKSTKKK